MIFSFFTSSWATSKTNNKIIDTKDASIQSKVLDYPQRTLRGNCLNLILQHLISIQLKSSVVECRFFFLFPGHKEDKKNLNCLGAK